MYAIRSYYEKPDIAKYKKLSGEYNDMVKVYKTKYSKEGKGLSAGDLRKLLDASYDGKEKVARITSYNVCYTKLLRT